MMTPQDVKPGYLTSQDETTLLLLGFCFLWLNGSLDEGGRRWKKKYRVFFTTRHIVCVPYYIYIMTLEIGTS